ncbi:BtrH N-terminal domain-containing protein [Paenibacillus bovis]|uniref:Uncharacterized protein n=1 Tax=Paenibacillus bovis TaxID=1616788 RepID=A0A172ZEV4_9BACL|nr:BtrH N-terminal domain-containing protein [Paenibacillus bovis]ANF95690.1 hypothetical protein AR543_06545 [Paenibacillus bovis]
MSNDYSFLLKPLPGFERANLIGNMATIASYFNRGYLQAFAHAWTFPEYQAHVPLEYQALGQEARAYHTTYEQILGASGLQHRIHRNQSAAQAIELIQQESRQQRPVLVKGDTFHCSWLKKDYQTVHNAHFYIVTHYDVLSNQLLCTDVAYLTQNYAQPLPEFEAGFTGDLITFASSTEQSPPPSPADLYTLLVECARRNLGHIDGSISVFDSMEVLADRLVELDHLEQQHNMATLSESGQRVQLEMLLLMQARIQFLLLLEHLSDSAGEPLKLILHAFQQSVRSWSAIRESYLQLSLSSDERLIRLQHIAEQIRVVAMLERNIAQTILHDQQIHRIHEQYEQRWAMIQQMN